MPTPSEIVAEMRVRSDVSVQSINSRMSRRYRPISGKKRTCDENAKKNKRLVLFGGLQVREKHQAMPPSDNIGQCRKG